MKILHASIHLHVYREFFKRWITNMDDQESLIQCYMQENQCIIGGIGESDQIIFAITLQPTELFSNFVSRSKRVWLFKSNNSLKGVIAAPLGLYARYVAYFPYRR